MTLHVPITRRIFVHILRNVDQMVVVIITRQTLAAQKTFHILNFVLRQLNLRQLPTTGPPTTAPPTAGPLTPNNAPTSLPTSLPTVTPLVARHLHPVET